MNNGQVREVRVTPETRTKVLRSALSNKVVKVTGLTNGQRRALENAKAPGRSSR